MTKKIRLFVLLPILSVTTAVWIAAQRPDDKPPGVRPDLWIRLSENSGIALNDTSKMYNVQGNHGVLMVKLGNKWEPVYLESGVAGFRRLSK